MPNVVAHFEVKDRDLWLTSTVRTAALSAQGVTDLRNYIDPTNPARVALTGDVADLDALVAWLHTDAGAEVLATEGVLPETIVMLVES